MTPSNEKKGTYYCSTQQRWYAADLAEFLLLYTTTHDWHVTTSTCIIPAVTRSHLCCDIYKRRVQCFRPIYYMIIIRNWHWPHVVYLPRDWLRYSGCDCICCRVIHRHPGVGFLLLVLIFYFGDSMGQLQEYLEHRYMYRLMTYTDLFNHEWMNNLINNIYYNNK